MTTITPIHETVREHYAERIKKDAPCCGPDSCSCSDNKLYPEDLARGWIASSQRNKSARRDMSSAWI